MGSKIKRLKGTSKAPKWGKGKSSTSNPPLKKFRDLANQGFLKRIENSNLTVSALEKHEFLLQNFPTVRAKMALTEAPSVDTVLTANYSDKVSIACRQKSDYIEDKEQLNQQPFIDLQKEMEELSVDENDDLKSQAKTFATQFTTCSIPDFEKFFANFNVKSEHQVEMLAFHASVQDILKQKNLSENTSSYFVAIIMALEGVLDKPACVAAGLALLVRVIKSVPLRILRKKAEQFGSILNNIIVNFQDSDNTQLLTHVLGSLSILLRAQQLGMWLNSDILKTWLKNILVFSIHSQPKIRKAAQYNVSAVLKGSWFMASSSLVNADENCSLSSLKSEEEEETVTVDKGAEIVENDTTNNSHSVKGLDIHPAAEFVADFLLAQLKNCGSLALGNKTLLHTLVFIRQIVMTVPRHKLQILLRRLLGLVSLGQCLVNTSVLQIVSALCQAAPPEAILPLSLCITLITTLTKETPGVSCALIPSTHDVTAVQCWSSTVADVIRLLFRLNLSSGLVWTSEWSSLTLKYWRSNSVPVLRAVEDSLSRCLACAYDKINTENSKEFEKDVRAVLRVLESALSTQYQEAWPCIFRLFGQCFSELGLYYPALMMPALKTLCQLRANNDELASEGELEKAIGKAILGMGVEAVVFSAPLEVTGDVYKDQKYMWLPRVLTKHVRGSRLIFFRDHFVPLASKCFEIVERLRGNPSQLLVCTTYRTLEYQIWAMLPSFAKDAMDVEQAQSDRNFAKQICQLIEFRDSLRIEALAGLRNMIDADNSIHGKLAKNSANYLPVLFNLYLREPKTSRNLDQPDVIDKSHRLAILSTIKSYIKIVPNEVASNLLTQVITKYGEESGGHWKRALLSIARCFVGCATVEQIEKIYGIVKPLISSAKAKSQQKAAYRMLEELFTIATAGASDFIDNHLSDLEELLLQSVSKAAPSSRAPRLRVTKVVLEKVTSGAEADSCETFLRSVVAESVICCARNNSKATRKAAFSLLAGLHPAMVRVKGTDDDTAARECLRLLWAGLLDRDTLCASSIFAITAYIYQTKNTMPLDLLVMNAENICTLMASHSREVVQACLSFVKGVVALYPVAILSSVLKIIVNGIIAMTPDCARRYRLKVKSILNRLMRKYGSDYISSLIPAKHEILHRRLRNIRKENNRLKRKKDVMEAEDAEERNEYDDDVGDNLISEKAPPSSLAEVLAEIDPDLAGADDDEKPSRFAADQRRHHRYKPVSAWVAEEDDSGDEVLDLLSADAAHAIITKKPKLDQKSQTARRPEDRDEYGGFRIDPASGKLIITDEREDRSESRVADKDLETAALISSGAQAGKISNKRERDDDSEAESVDVPVRKQQRKKLKLDYGSEFRSKKGRGDVMRKGQKTKPFAYVPITKERLNKRKQAKFKGQFRSLVKGAKKGAQIGSKQRTRKRN